MPTPKPQPQSPNPQLVILGGGFGGLTLAQNLRRAPVDITLIDKRNFHLFQPLLYQVATGGLSPANIAAPLRSLLKRQPNTRVLMAQATGFDLDKKFVHTSAGDVPFDTLIVATGATHSYFGHPEWEPIATGLKTVEDATEMRRHILRAFETAESLTDPKEREPWLTFVIVGGGPTGVELAGMLAELAHYTLRSNFRNIDPGSAKILLLEAAERVLMAFPPKLGDKARAALEKLGVTVCLGAKLTDLSAEAIVYEKNGTAITLPTRTVLWSAGVQASPLGKMLATATGAETDRQGRVMVEPDLSLKGQPNVFIIGDLAHCKGPDGKPLPGIAPVAMQQGRYLAKLLQARLKGQSMPPFKYHNKGNMATIGRGAAIADLGWIKLSGYLAWLAWLFIHLMFLIGFENRFLVLCQWAWAYLTRNRSARLITGNDPSSGAPPAPD